MELIEKFFKIKQTEKLDNGFSSQISLAQKHIVYEGHFPVQPVTPGVIQLKIVHELIERFLSVKIQLISIANCKFLKVINPNIISEITVKINFVQKEKDLTVNANALFEKEILFKLSANYKII